MLAGAGMGTRCGGQGAPGTGLARHPAPDTRHPTPSGTVRRPLSGRAQGPIHGDILVTAVTFQMPGRAAGAGGAVAEAVLARQSRPVRSQGPSEAAQHHDPLQT